jgi:hypothetical protein
MIDGAGIHAEANHFFRDRLRLDIDSEGVFDINDALITTRHLVGFTNSALNQGVNINLPRNSSNAIAQHIANSCPAPPL